MNIEKAKEVSVETHKGNKSELEYREIFDAAKTLMVEALKSGSEETDSALYAATGMNLNYACMACINALKALIKDGILKKRHEMVEGYKSTNFVSLA